MRIAIFTDSYYPKIDGIVTSIMNSSRLLAEKGHKIIIFAPTYEDRREPRLHHNIRVYRSFSLSLFSYEDVKIPLPNINKSIRILKEFSPDIIHIHAPGTLGMFGIICSKLYNIPCIGTYHTLVSEQLTYLSLKRLTKFDRLIERIKSMDVKNRNGKKNLFQSNLQNIVNNYSRNARRKLASHRQEKKRLGKDLIWKLSCNLYGKCDLITVPSLSIKKQLLKYNVSKPVVVLSNGIDLKSFPPKKSYKARKQVNILHVGRISFEKNVDVIIRSFRLLSSEKGMARLTIVGDGPALASLKNLAKSLKLNNVEFAGCLVGKPLIEAYHDGDIFVTASTMETQGMVILEAMSCGLPVIGVDSYAIPDLVKDCVNGLVIKPFDEIAMKESIVKLVEKPCLLRKLGRSSIMLAKEHDLGNIVMLLEKIYLQLISHKVK